MNLSYSSINDIADYENVWEFGPPVTQASRAVTAVLGKR